MNFLLSEIKRIFNGFKARVVARVPQPVLFTVLAFFTGLFAGVAAYVLKALIGEVTDTFQPLFDKNRANLIFLALPLIGTILAAAYQHYVARLEIYHGVSRLNRALQTGNLKLPFQLTVSPIIASTLTLGFGGSAGSEGPIAYTGGALGSNIGRMWNLSPYRLKALMACGAAAGIAGIFKAPIGGAFFALECMAIDMSTASIVAAVVASVTAALTAYILSGCTPDIYFPHALEFDMHWLPWVILFGVLAGFYSIYYRTVMLRMVAWFGGMKNHWRRNLIAGSIIGGALFLFPALYGEGYGFISQLLAGNFPSITEYSMFAPDGGHKLVIAFVLFGMMAVKAFATSSTTSGGGVAGDFAPALFAGAVTGFFFAVVFNLITYHVHLSPEMTLWFGHLPENYFAFFGMAAIMAATQRAPLMAIFLTLEMGSAFSLMVPVVVAATISYLVLRIFGPRIVKTI